MSKVSKPQLSNDQRIKLNKLKELRRRLTLAIEEIEFDNMPADEALERAQLDSWGNMAA